MPKLRRSERFSKFISQNPNLCGAKSPAASARKTFRAFPRLFTLPPKNSGRRIKEGTGVTQMGGGCFRLTWNRGVA